MTRSRHAEDDALVVVGGGAAGQACVQAYRDRGGERPVLMLSADDRPPYFRPHLTKDLVTGEVEPDAIGLVGADWYAAHGVELRLACPVEGIDVTNRTVATATGPVPYGRLVLATGSCATRVPVPGADDERVLTIRSASDAERLLTQAATREPVLVVGSGFVGCEIAASLRARGLEVTMLTTEARPQADRLGDAAGALLDGWLRDLGVTVHVGAHVAAFATAGDRVEVRLEDGERLEAGWSVSATGATAQVDLAVPLGIVRDGAIPVDATMQTVVPGIAAAGDIARAHHARAGRFLAVEHWGDAQRMGEIAGTVAAGGHDEWREVPGFWTAIAGRQLKYVSWGDGWDRWVARPSRDGLTVWYGRDGAYAGVLTYGHDDDLAAGTALIEAHAPFDLP